VNGEWSALCRARWVGTVGTNLAQCRICKKIDNEKLFLTINYPKKQSIVLNKRELFL
jgi:hypothetical protein